MLKELRGSNLQSQRHHRNNDIDSGDTIFGSRGSGSSKAEGKYSKLIRSLLRNPYLWIILITFVIRLITLGLYPIGDTTEARYIEMARKMLETGIWIMPQYAYDVPFWGKPPLTIWLHAISFKVFGISEFTARLPSFLISMLIVALVYYFSKQQRGKTIAWMASVLLSTNILFFILSGAVIIDPLMTLGTTLSMVAFWQIINNRGQVWGYLFFIGLAIGLMSKGPVAVILTCIPIAVWLTVSGNWKCSWRSIPLFSGTALMLTLTLPWYILAEYNSPGFLNYFILGEHWARFTQTGWVSLYGTSHASYTGAIWVEWLVSAFPISLVLIIALLRLSWRKKSAAISILKKDWSLYLILWLITPMLFFTFSGNILATYVLPGIPAAAILVAGFWQIQPDTTNHQTQQNRKSIVVVTIAGVVFPLLFLTAVIFHMPKVAARNSEKFLIEKYQKIDNKKHARLIYLYERPFSAEYYSKGKAEVIASTNEMTDISNQLTSVFFAVPFTYIQNVSEDLKKCLNRIGHFGRYVLFQRNQKICKE